MANLPIVAQVHAAADKMELVRSEMLKLIETTRAEDGCLQYDLHQDNENRAHFMFYETWTSRDLWRAHMEAPISPPLRRPPRARSGSSRCMR